MKVKAKVIMLPTDGESKISRYRTEVLSICCSGKYTKEEASNGWENQHLYVTVSQNIEPIKDGDWCLFFWDGGQIGSDKPQQYFSKLGHVINKNLQKVIATTDESLLIDRSSPDGKTITFKEKLPKLSDDFLRKFYELGGIDEVLVEYEGYFNNTGQRNWVDESSGKVFDDWKLKVAEDNTITIHQIKDSWNREEVEYLIKQYAFEEHIISNDSTKVNDWIKINL